MDEVIVDPTSMASFSIGDGVRDHLWPIVAKSSKSVFELGARLVSSARTTMSFLGALCASLCERHRVRFHRTIGDTMFA